MSIKTRMPRSMFIPLTIFAIAIMACSGGSGGGSSPTPAPVLSVLPSGYDFGIMTDDNTLDTLEVTIRNSGTAALRVSNIDLTGTGMADFVLNKNAGANPCGGGDVVLGLGESCNVTVDFTPQGLGDFTADVTIASNDPTTPVYNLGLRGSKEPISEINVKINQVIACPREPGLPVTAYVAVTDQGRFPVTGLLAEDFTIEEGDVPIDWLLASWIADSHPTISVALLLDYSNSITNEPDNVDAMRRAATSFVQQLDERDEAQIVKFGTQAVVVADFTSDKDDLISAIESTPDTGGGTTLLYDTLVAAIGDISERTKDRKAIIILTDGEDNDGKGVPLSDADLYDVIADAREMGVPVFTIGLGDRVNPDDLSELANSTGGTYSESATPDNLLTIYNQLANLLFENQYILTYNTALEENQGGVLKVTATYNGSISGEDTYTILPCSP
jgi:VWFA-related protein